MGRKIRIPEGQEHLPFQSRSRRGVFAYATPYERRGIKLTMFLLVLTSLSYVYFIMSSVTYAAKTEELNRAARLLTTEVSRLEAKYLARAEELTESYARSVGFVEPDRQIFVEKTSFISGR